MRAVLFCHSLRSCWNHGNAHFLRGVVTELLARGHEVRVFEPLGGWSAANLVREHGREPLTAFARAFPHLRSTEYDLESLDLDQALDGADLVLVHEWSAPALVARVGAHRAQTRGYRLLFHDTHHRAATAPARMAAYDLRHYDGVLAFGRVIRDLYLARGWAARAWTWHEAADTTVFRPQVDAEPRGAGSPSGVEGRPSGDLVWIGNWGDGERSAELDEFLVRPVERLGLRAEVHGVRYPAAGLARLASAGIRHRGWLPNHQVPRVFARHQITVHVPRRPYARALPGIPTIRVFEALACGIPLVSSPWDDAEELFTPGKDFLIARTGADMARCLRAVLMDRALSRELAAHGLRTINERHTCRHRVDELIRIGRELGVSGLALPAPGAHPAPARDPAPNPRDQRDLERSLQS